MDAVPHAWDVDVAEAWRIQEQLRQQVITTDDFGTLATVAGLDAAFRDDGATTRAAAVVLAYPTLAVVAEATAHVPTTFPYIPGLLSFREIPALLAVLDALPAKPDMLLCDGQGIMHPRRLGIAAHLGVLTGLPAIGVAKSRLIGTHAPVPDERGAWVPVFDKGETIGAALRSRPGTKPLYISPGHRVSLATAIEIVMACTTRYRLPETTRRADALSKLREE